MKLIAAAVATLSMLGSASAQSDPTKAREDVRMVAPALEKYAQGTVFGDVWKRPGLSVRDRSVVTLAALIGRNQTVEMPFYLNVALDNGVKLAEISEIITHLAFYSGWGNAMSRSPSPRMCLPSARSRRTSFPLLRRTFWRSTKPLKRIVLSGSASSSERNFRA